MALMHTVSHPQPTQDMLRVFLSQHSDMLSLESDLAADFSRKLNQSSILLISTLFKILGQSSTNAIQTIDSFHKLGGTEIAGRKHVNEIHGWVASYPLLRPNFIALFLHFLLAFPCLCGSAKNNCNKTSPRFSFHPSV